VSGLNEMGESVRKRLTQRAAHASLDLLAEPVVAEPAKFWRSALVEVCSFCMALRVTPAVGLKEHQDLVPSMNLCQSKHKKRLDKWFVLETILTLRTVRLLFIV
jgi:hypothetical protein